MNQRIFRRRDEPANIQEAADRTEEALREMEQHDERPDPAPSAPAIAEERAQQLLTNISSQTLGELRGLRDQLDDLMRDMNARRDMLRDAIKSHAEFAQTAIQAKIIIAESIAKMRADFERSNTPLPPVHNVGGR